MAPKANRTQLGDPTSLKAETSDTVPTPTEGGAAPQNSDHKSLKQIATETNKKNPSMLGDPISLKAETSKTIPTEDEAGAKKSSKL